MKLSQLASKPQLIEVTLDDEAIVSEYGEAITFYTYDRQPIDLFMRLAQSSESNSGSVVDIVKDLILDEDGKKLLVGDTMLPSRVLMKAITKITQILGN